MWSQSSLELMYRKGFSSEFNSWEYEHWQAKVRQVLQDERYFVRVDSGVYTLTE